MPAPPDQRTASQCWQVNTSSPASTISCSRGGPCHTCRRQRLRCDATKPSCNKCLARGVECLGYGPQAILWVQPKLPAHVAKSIDASTKEPESMAATGKKKGRPRLVLMPKNTRESPAQSEPQARHESEWVFVNHADSPDGRRALVKKQVVSPELVPAGYHNNMLALSMLDYSMPCALPSHHDPFTKARLTCPFFFATSEQVHCFRYGSLRQRGQPP